MRVIQSVLPLLSIFSQFGGIDLYCKLKAVPVGTIVKRRDRFFTRDKKYVYRRIAKNSWRRFAKYE